MFLCETARVLGCHEIEESLDSLDTTQSIRVLGRIVERTADFTTWEADPFGVTGPSVTTPGVNNKLTDIPVTDLVYRSSAVIWHARCNSRHSAPVKRSIMVW